MAPGSPLRPLFVVVVGLRLTAIDVLLLRFVVSMPDRPGTQPKKSALAGAGSLMCS